MSLSYIECIDPLGMQSGDIKDSQITASSYRPADLPHYGRLHNGKYWCAKDKKRDGYLQVDLGQVSSIFNLSDQVISVLKAFRKTSRHVQCILYRENLPRTLPSEFLPLFDNLLQHFVSFCFVLKIDLVLV